jgi:hypothetical protein
VLAFFALVFAIIVAMTAFIPSIRADLDVPDAQVVPFLIVLTIIMVLAPAGGAAGLFVWFNSLLKSARRKQGKIDREPVANTPSAPTPAPVHDMSSSTAPDNIAADTSANNSGSSDDVLDQLFERLSEKSKSVADAGMQAIKIERAKPNKIALAQVEFEFDGTFSADVRRRPLAGGSRDDPYEPFWAPVKGVGSARLVVHHGKPDVISGLRASSAVVSGLSFDDLQDHVSLNRETYEEFVADAAADEGVKAGNRLLTAFHQMFSPNFQGTYRIQRESFDVIEMTEVTYTYGGKQYSGVLTNDGKAYAGETPKSGSAVWIGSAIAIVGIVVFLFVVT